MTDDDVERAAACWNQLHACRVRLNAPWEITDGAVTQQGSLHAGGRNDRWVWY